MIHSKLFIIFASFTKANGGVFLEGLNYHERKNWNVLSQPSKQSISTKNNLNLFTTRSPCGMCFSNPQEISRRILRICQPTPMIYRWMRRKIRSSTAKNQGRERMTTLWRIRGNRYSKMISPNFNFTRLDKQSKGWIGQESLVTMWL